MTRCIQKRCYHKHGQYRVEYRAAFREGDRIYTTKWFSRRSRAVNAKREECTNYHLASEVRNS